MFMESTIYRRFARVLGSQEIFAGSSPEDLMELAASATTRSYVPGQTIFLKGDPGNRLMVVLRGRVKVSSIGGPDVREFAFNIFGDGDIFGEIAFLDGGVRTTDATALDNTELLILTRKSFLPFLARHPTLAQHLVALLCARLRQTTDLVEDLRFRDSDYRLARQLLLLAGRAHEMSVSDGAISVRIRQEDLGELAGVSRESTTRTIGKWRRANVLRTGRCLIEILDKDQLADLAKINRSVYASDPHSHDHPLWREIARQE